MSLVIEVKVPDIGDFDTVPIIELFVKVGDSLNVDDAICTLESDKATMDVPSSVAGVVKEVLVELGDKVGEGAVLMKIERVPPSERRSGERPPCRSSAAAPAATRLPRPAARRRRRPRHAGRRTPSTTWSCSAPAPAATRPPSAPRTWVSRPRSSSATPASAACA